MPIMIKDFKQANLPFMKWNKATSEGVCVSISVHWLIKRAQGEDFWTWIQTVEGISSILNTQATGESRFRVESSVKTKTPGAIPEANSQNRNSWIGYLISEGGLKRDSFIKRNSDFTTTAKNLLNHKKFIGMGVYSHIDLYGSIGGHTVAMDDSGGKPLFMDPNLGEVSFDSKNEFIQWFPTYVNQYSYRDTASSPIKKFDEVEVWSFQKT